MKYDEVIKAVRKGFEQYDLLIGYFKIKTGMEYDRTIYDKAIKAFNKIVIGLTKEADTPIRGKEVKKNMRCDRCGKYFAANEPGSSHMFVADSDLTVEETVNYCKLCTACYGPANSRQFVNPASSRWVSTDDR